MYVYIIILYIISKSNHCSVKCTIHFTHQVFVSVSRQAGVLQACASATESEYAALFIKGQSACFPITVLKALGYTQKPTIIYCDNLSTQGIAQREVTLQRSKAIHTRYHWIQNRIDQGQFIIMHMPGSIIDADYLTKIHPRPQT